MHHEPSRQDSQPAHLYACHHVAPHSSLITHHHLTQLAVDGAAGVDAYADGLPSAHETARATLQELRGGRPFTAECAGGCAERGFAEAVRTGAWSNSPLRSASVRLLRPLRARLAALGGSALPGGRGWATGRPQPLPRVLEPAASKVADPTVSVNTQAPRLCRANAPVSARGIGKRRRDRPARGCTPPDGAALQSKATSSSSRTWAPSETCVGRRVYFTAFGL